MAGGCPGCRQPRRASPRSKGHPVARGGARRLCRRHGGTVRPKGRGGYKPATVRSYAQHLRVYIESSALGALKVTEVSRADVQAFADELLAAGLSAGTVSNVLNPIQAFYRRAEDREEIGFNPTQRIDLPGAPAVGRPGSRRRRKRRS